MVAPKPSDLEVHRPALVAHCYRMLGSPVDADDAVQEALVRAWRALPRFEGRSSLRTWLIRIATRVCLDQLQAAGRRARPMDLCEAGTPAGPLGEALPEASWVLPLPDAWLDGGSPDDRVLVREAIRLAFVAALQTLPPRQRAVLLLREVLDHSAAEVAETLEMSVPAVNSALQRARATLASSDPGATASVALTEADAVLRDRFVDAFERYDLDALSALCHEDVVLNMPPYPLWMRGTEHVRAWMEGTGAVCRGSRLLPVGANGMLAFGQYHSDPAGGFAPWALVVLDVVGGRVSMQTYFLDTEVLFPRFGLPDRLPA